MIRKFTTALMKLPSWIGPRVMAEKSGWPKIAPMMGVIRSSTTLVTIAPNAPPMMTPMAMSSTLPFMANSLNSLSIFPIVNSSLS